MSGDEARSGGVPLAAIVAKTLPAATGLACVSFALLVALGYLVAPFALGVWFLAAAFFYFHAVFVASVAWKAMRPSQSVFRCVRTPGLAAGALLLLPILMFALLDGKGASHSCADGAAYGDSLVPKLPWLWIGWALLTAAALPARCIGAVIREAPPLVPIGRRLLHMLPFLPPILLFGLPFQRHTPNCAPPFDGWGFMEGGAVLFPLLGLFWFSLSFSMAILSAAFVDQDRLG